MKEKVFQELITMGLSNEHECIDMLIALYPSLSRSDQADIMTMIKEYYGNC